MSLCESCGLEIAGDAELCPHHARLPDEDWAVTNRTFCDLLHRGDVPDHPPSPQLDDDLPVMRREAA